MNYLSRWRIFLVFTVCVIGIWFGVQNFFSKQFLSSLPDFLPKSQVALGLDLQGGSSILLEVNLSKIAEEYLNTLSDEFKRAFRKDRIGYVSLRSNPKNASVHFTLRSLDQKEMAIKAIKSIDNRLDVQVKDSGDVQVMLTKEALAEREDAAVQQSIQIVTRRIDEMGTKEPSIQKQGGNRILVQLPGVDDPNIIIDMLGKTAKLSFRLVHPTLRAEDVAGVPPYGYEILESSDADDQGAGRKYLVQKKVDVGGEMLTGASVSSEGAPGVTFSLDAIGARKFADITRRHIGRPFAIVLDDKVISAPVINSVIPGGRGVIEGRFTLQQARDLSILLRAGALPAPLTVLEERTVGPELGSDSIKAGQIAVVVSVAFVIAFMFVFYGILFGGIANVCLVMNLVLLLAGLSLLGATLTLPGIAGIALTLGMAVDANILIYERIREEIRDRQPPLSAISAGYARAMATILDSNVATLIGAAILYHFGNGPVKGFAVSLALGILISMFTAIALSRVLTLMWLKLWGQQRPLPL